MDTLITRTIIDQLGGGRFQLMTGAKGFTARPDGLTFRLPGSGGFCRHGVNHVSITLTARDDYNITFSRVRMQGLIPVTTTISTHEGIYAEQLCDVFTAATGLQTSLGTMGR